MGILSGTIYSIKNTKNIHKIQYIVCFPGIVRSAQKQVKPTTGSCANCYFAANQVKPIVNR